MSSFIKKIFTIIVFLNIMLVSPLVIAETKLGYVKVDEVIRKANIAKQAEDKLKKEFAPRDNELKKMGANLKNLVSKFDKEQSVMTNAEKQKMQREIADVQF